jgi:LmbE family N-acetylglucosaminyl deacetylase
MILNENQSISVVVAHPDDEVLAFGGIMARHAAKGGRVDTLILATGLTSRTHEEEHDLDILRQEAVDASKVLGVREPEFGDFPDNRMDTVALLDVAQRVEAFFRSTQPDVILTHHAGDLNVDHRIVQQAVMIAARPLPNTKPIAIYAGEVLSSSEFAPVSDWYVPNTYVDIAAWLEQKQQALECYRGEIRDWPHPRSVQAVEHLARKRGSEVGLEAAETLHLLRAVATS